MIKFPTERSVSGRLLFWDHLSDQGSCILCHDNEHDEWTVYRATLPVLAPPAMIPTPDAHDDHPKQGSDSSSRKIDDAHPRVGIDNSKLRTDEPGKGLSKFDRPLGVDSHEPIQVDDAIEVDFDDLCAFEEECSHPFSFFYLTSDSEVRRIAKKCTMLTMSMLKFHWILLSHENSHHSHQCHQRRGCANNWCTKRTMA